MIKGVEGGKNAVDWCSGLGSLSLSESVPGLQGSVWIACAETNRRPFLASPSTSAPPNNKSSSPAAFPAGGCAGKGSPLLSSHSPPRRGPKRVEEGLSLGAAIGWPLRFASGNNAIKREPLMNDTHLEKHMCFESHAHLAITTDFTF